MPGGALRQIQEVTIRTAIYEEGYFLQRTRYIMEGTTEYWHVERSSGRTKITRILLGFSVHLSFQLQS